MKGELTWDAPRPVKDWAMRGERPQGFGLAASRRPISGWVSILEFPLFGSVGRRGEDNFSESGRSIWPSGPKRRRPTAAGRLIRYPAVAGPRGPRGRHRARLRQIRQLPRDQALAACHTAEETEDFHGVLTKECIVRYLSLGRNRYRRWQG